MQFIMAGQLSGRLTPSLLTVQEIQHLAEVHIGRTSKFFEKFPHILYQTATATLVEANFQTLKFQFIISLSAKLATANISPFFVLRQVGFMAQNSYDNHTTCLAFKTTPHAIVRDGKWYMLETLNQCPIFGRAMICQNLQFNLLNFNDCISAKNFGAATCPLTTCPTGTLFIPPRQESSYDPMCPPFK